MGRDSRIQVSSEPNGGHGDTTSSGRDPSDVSASLEQLLRAAQLPKAGEVSEILKQGASKLDYAHRQNVFHHRLKPSNILLSRAADGQLAVEISGFGVEDELETLYAAPELLRSERADGRADQYSLAVITYELLAGKNPFAMELDRGTRSAESIPTSIYQVNPSLTATVAKVMERALASDPEERFSSLSAFAGALSIALAEGPEYEVQALGDTAGEPELEVLKEVLRRDSARSGRAIKAALVAFFCFLVTGAIMYIVRLNSVPQAPIQVLDTKSGTVTAPPPERPRVPVIAHVRQQRKVQPMQRPSTPKVSDPIRASREIARKASPLPEDTREPGSADIDLISEPPGAKIAVDGRADAACTAPCTMSLPGGRHALTAGLDGYAGAKRIFNIPETKSLYIPLSPDTGTLLVSSIPAGASVSVDGRSVGQTPATLRLSAGIHRIALRDGSRQHEEAVNVAVDSFQTRTIRW